MKCMYCGEMCDDRAGCTGCTAWLDTATNEIDRALYEGLLKASGVMFKGGSKLAVSTARIILNAYRHQAYVLGQGCSAADMRA